MRVRCVQCVCVCVYGVCGVCDVCTDVEHGDDLGEGGSLGGLLLPAGLDEVPQGGQAVLRHRRALVLEAHRPLEHGVVVVVQERLRPRQDFLERPSYTTRTHIISVRVRWCVCGGDVTQSTRP